MGTGEGRARSRSWFFTEKLVNGLMERSGRFWGRFIWGRISLWWSCVNCGGGDCSPGSGWLAGPMVCRRPPCAALVLGSRLGPGSPASVYTSVGDSEGSAAPQIAAPAATLSYAWPRLSSSWYMATQVVTLVLRPHRFAIWFTIRAARFIAASLMAVAASVPCSTAAASTLTTSSPSRAAAAASCSSSS